ncbi:unnamed protein product (macronuclear) [Paramecium tetraurelia]|uniref:Uncharacterized protein n=1 Tax=Paramecium tetraurelia TaxID=5888 RepID=A0CCA0_PARTE|nr:uncharacterized protein GSPATT00037201001 [Paramecium tetraurelia]CAK68417.1 unnamed protein product [Paramecium tetraurelia]|eukprot:XP_001435814.1 hypothetical protein (macronuclear) [Paramecium tetraurelia strain d4-2]
MQGDFCAVCAQKQKKCHSDVHDNMEFYFVTEELTQQVVMEDLKRRYQTSSREKLTKRRPTKINGYRTLNQQSNLLNINNISNEVCQQIKPNCTLTSNQ